MWKTRQKNLVLPFQERRLTENSYSCLFLFFIAVLYIHKDSTSSRCFLEVEPWLLDFLSALVSLFIHVASSVYILLSCFQSRNKSLITGGKLIKVRAGAEAAPILGKPSPAVIPLRIFNRGRGDRHRRFITHSDSFHTTWVIRR